MENKRKRILVVEDDTDLRKILVHKVGLLNFEIFEAADGEEAIAKVIDEKPDLVLLDIMLPKLDGFQVLERIRHSEDSKIANTKVIILSNLWSDKDILRAQALKIDEYYVKANTNLDEVYAKIQKILK